MPGNLIAINKAFILIMTCFFLQTVVTSFHLYFSPDSTISSTAAATIRQSISVILDRMVEEDKQMKGVLFD